MKYLFATIALITPTFVTASINNEELNSYPSSQSVTIAFTFSEQSLEALVGNVKPTVLALELDNGAMYDCVCGGGGGGAISGDYGMGMGVGSAGIGMGGFGGGDVGAGESGGGGGSPAARAPAASPPETTPPETATVTRDELFPDEGSGKTTSAIRVGTPNASTADRPASAELNNDSAFGTHGPAEGFPPSPELDEPETDGAIPPLD